MYKKIRFIKKFVSILCIIFLPTILTFTCINYFKSNDSIITINNIIQCLGLSFTFTILQLLYFPDRDLSKISLSIRTLLHYFSLLIIILIWGFVFKWGNLYDFNYLLLYVLIFSLIYIILWFTLVVSLKLDNNLLNEKLNEYKKRKK